MVITGCGGSSGNGTSSTAPVASSTSLAVTEDLPTSTTLIASDLENDPLTYSIVSNGNKGTATITDAATGAVDYVPNANETGADSFAFKASDGSLDSNIATITVTITPVDDAPVAQDDTLTTAEDTAGNGILVATDVDSPILSYSIVTNGSKGSAIITNGLTGAYTYTPDPGANGIDTFTFKARDGSDSNIATIAVTITPVDDAPAAQNDTLIMDEDTVSNGVLVATDVDSPTLTYSIVSNGNKGSAIITNATTGAYSYTPDPDANGADSFAFKANDGFSDSNIATITVSINAVEDAPVAEDGMLTTDEDTIGNDVLVATDAENQTLSYSIVSNGSKGTAIITNATTGAYYYTPDPDANGGDTFTFKASDGSDSNIATITVTITPINDPPVAVGSCGTTPQAQTLNGTLSATDPDTADTLNFNLNADGSGGMGPITTAKGGTVTITNATTGAYSYEPATGVGNKRGLDSFEYQATDFDGAFNSATETVIVDQKIMPLGDSITSGEEWLGTAYLANALRIGYRKELYDLLTLTGGYNFDFVGSVVTDGNDPSIAATFTDIEHEGHDGWTAVEVAYGQIGPPPSGVQVWLDSNPADIILLHIGTNGLFSTSASDIGNILDEIDTWETANSNPITVLLALIIDRDPNEPQVTTFNNDVNTMAQIRIGDGDDIIIVNQQTALDYASDMSNSLHPNAAGYIKMANPWYTALETVLDKCP